MAQKEICILTNMCMVYDGERLLVQDRTKANWPGITFPGGHIEPNESIVESVIREVKEETGLDISDVQLCGIQQWTEENGAYRYIVFFFKTNAFSGTLKSSEEGDVFWIDKRELGNYVLANGFETMFEVFEHDYLSENYYWFDHGRWNVRNI